jgi:DNA polymerase-1
MIELLHTHPAGFKFDVIKYTKDKTTKRNTQRPSTDEEALLELRKIDKSGFIDRLLKHRELQKLFSTYMIGIRDKLSIRNKIHTSFLLHGTVTGRLSSREPNLQNIPRSTTTSDIKKMFVCPKGFVLLEVDYSQAELRVVAELAEEETMLNWFREGQNIHTAVAAQLAGWGDRISEVKAILKNPEHPDNLFWEKQKKKAKIVNFGILYGQTAENLAGSMSSETERVTSEEAQEFLDKWLDTFPRIRKYMKNTHKFVKEHGYVKSLFGRKRRLPGVYSELRGEVNKALRDSVNAPIQGTASDFTLFSSIIIHEERLKGTLPASMRQVYTVHDSLGFYIKPEHIHEAVPKIIEICNNPKTQQYFDFELTKVKMKVSPEVGANWGSLEEYSPTMDYKTLLTNDK